MTVHDVFRKNAPMLRSLARTGVSLEDIAYLPMFEEFERLSRDGLKVVYIVAILCDAYAVSERTVWRVVNKYRRVINDR